MRILVVKPSSLGDVIHALPAVRLIKQHHPNAHISWLLNSSFMSLGGLFDDVDTLIPFKRKEWGRVRNFGQFLAFLRELRHQQFDLVFDFQGLFRSGVCAYATGARQIAGFADARELAPWFYRQRVTVNAAAVHAIERNIALVNEVLGTEYGYASPRISITEDVQRELEDVLEQKQIDSNVAIVAVAPVSRWPSKTWPPAFFAATLDAVAQSAEAPVQFCLLGTSEERTVGEEIVERSEHARVHNLMGDTPLPVTVELLRRSRTLLTNDSGPMHIAAALEVPTVSLFGPTDPSRTGPYGDIHKRVQSEVNCAPCFNRICPLPEQLCLTDRATPEHVSAQITGTL